MRLLMVGRMPSCVPHCWMAAQTQLALLRMRWRPLLMPSKQSLTRSAVTAVMQKPAVCQTHRMRKLLDSLVAADIQPCQLANRVAVAPVPVFKMLLSMRDAVRPPCRRSPIEAHLAELCDLIAIAACWFVRHTSSTALSELDASMLIIMLFSSDLQDSAMYPIASPDLCSMLFRLAAHMLCSG